MGKDTNFVGLDGRLGTDPTLKKTQDGRPYALLNVATSTRGKKNGAGQWEDETDWHRVVVWGDDGEYLARSARKGDKIYIAGELQTRSWEKDGQKRYITEVKAKVAKFWPKDGGKRAGRQEPPAVEDDDDSIPF